MDSFVMEGKMSKRLVVTGHRPERIPNEKKTRQMIRQVLHELKPDMVYQGMASGVDVWTAAEAWREGIPYESVKPWAGHKVVPQHVYDWVVKNTAELHTLDPRIKYPGPTSFLTRNIWMVDRADIMMAIWDGKANGGTYHAVKYAQSKGLEIHRIDPIRHIIDVL